MTGISASYGAAVVAAEAATSSGSVDWVAFLSVCVSALVAAVLVVSLYALGMRMLTRAGRIPVVIPAEFTDAITVISEAEARDYAKRAAKAERKNPLTDAQKRVAQYTAYLLFGLCAGAVLFGIYLIVPALHR